VAALKRFSVITGGPGTGKTFTIARILAILAGQPGGDRLRVKLAAPTGKAAGRLLDSLRQAREALELAPGPSAVIPDDVSTIHRLLRPVYGTPHFRHNRNDPLPIDVLIVDEASMVDLALMAKLLEAVPAAARVIIVGDKDQLASVEAGSVLGDICGRDRPRGFSPEFSAAVGRLTEAAALPAAEAAAPLDDCIVELRHSYRFSERGSIGELSRAVNRGDGECALAILADPGDEGVEWLQPAAGVDSLAAMEERILRGYGTGPAERDPESMLQALGRFRVLCAHNVGAFGAQFFNRFAERVLTERGVIRASAGSPWYTGRPVLITRNDYTLGLFNGDIGIALPSGRDGGGSLWVHFPGSEGETRLVPPFRLPPHETVYAMTVHKSQGSEFEEVLLILPPKDSPALTRELVYTAMTRARSRIVLWGNRRVLETAVGRRIERATGLREALWGPGAG
jgi:exodeoxyribonuclease V alpha subunit